MPGKAVFGKKAQHQQEEIVLEVSVQWPEWKVLQDDGHGTELGSQGGTEDLDQGVVLP